MGKVIQLRRPVAVGDQVKLGDNLIYSVTRIEGKSLFGYQKNDPEPNGERWICKDYSKPERTVLNGKEIVCWVTHLDGKRIL
jgi:hypothetical protein